MRNWKGERRTNATHAGTTDPEAKLMRKGNGQPAKLCYGAHALMGNRQGLCTELDVADASLPEHRMANRLLGRARQRRWKIKTAGGDKGYCVRALLRAAQPRHRPARGEGFYTRLIGAGRLKKVALVACMRKLLTLNSAGQHTLINPDDATA